MIDMQDYHAIHINIDFFIDFQRDTLRNFVLFA